jgi:tetratricopeptide (TPR) repeat protein
VLSQLGRNDDALAMLASIFGNNQDPVLTELRAALSGGDLVPYSLVTSAQEGIAEVLFTVAELIRGDAPGAYVLLYSRGSEILAPQNSQAMLLSAQILEELDQFDLANEALANVSPEDPTYVSAQLTRVDVLHRAKDLEAAVVVAEDLASSFGNIPAVQSKLGDSYRQLEQFENAIGAYSIALDDFSDDDSSRWLIHYLRAIMHHQLDDWTSAEADFRAALAINPEQPHVLNYLGYSLVERNEKLDEALGMIETAVAARPDNGAIVDSLGWVLFQLGRYEESVGYMERAASLEAVDPIVNDHLGDVYWAVGREIEADFQWNRALSLNPDEELAARIRLKLESGLDTVLISEGSDPIRPVDDDS